MLRRLAGGRRSGGFPEFDGVALRVVDPGEAAVGVDLLVDLYGQAGATQLRFVCLLAAPEGLAVLHQEHPDVPVFTAAIDRQLDEHGYIRPGLGDAGDRLYGTK